MHRKIAGALAALLLAGAAQASVQTAAALKPRFATGMRPTGADFANLIDSAVDARVDVRAYGAYADGTHAAETTVALTNAWAAAQASGACLYAPAGTYAFSAPLTGFSNLCLVGDGMGRTVLQYGYAQQAGDTRGAKSALLFPDGVSNVRLSDFTLQYTGTFDEGVDGDGANLGVIHGIRTLGISNAAFDRIEVTGFNAVGVMFNQGAAPSTNVAVTRSNLHHNREAGLWHYAMDGLRIEANELHENGLATDPGTGYGIACNNHGTYSRNVWVLNNRVYKNKRKGIDHHIAGNLTIEGNQIWGDTTAGAQLGDQIGGIYAGEVYGFVSIRKNRLWGFRDHGLSAAYTVSAIEVGWPRGGLALLTGPLDPAIEENEITDFDVTGGSQAGIPIQIHNDYENVYGRIRGNVIRANHTSTVLSIAETATTNGATFNKWTITDNDLSIDNLGANLVARVYQVTDAEFSRNRIRVGASTSSYKALVDFGPTSGITAPDLEVAGNKGRTPAADWKTHYGSYYAEERQNFVNGLRELDRVYTGSDTAGASLTVGYASAMPSSGTYKAGAVVWNTDATVSGSGGYATANQKYNIIGWRRLTNGSAHVLNTDWVELRGLTGQ